MTYKTKERAIRAYKKDWNGYPGMVYQFPRGHWSYCSADSPVGKDLVESGHIYKDHGVIARNWERI